MENTIQ